jgi:hypothetical protein
MVVLSFWEKINTQSQVQELPTQNPKKTLLQENKLEHWVKKIAE